MAPNKGITRNGGGSNCPPPTVSYRTVFYTRYRTIVLWISRGRANAARGTAFSARRLEWELAGLGSRCQNKAALYPPGAYWLGVAEEARTFPSDWMIEAKQFRDDVIAAAHAANGDALLEELRALRVARQVMELAPTKPAGISRRDG